MDFIPVINDMFIGYQSNYYTNERGRPRMLHKLHVTIIHTMTNDTTQPCLKHPRSPVEAAAD